MAPNNLRDFLAQDIPDYDWLIPGLIERQDRWIITGREGKGKSTLLRQVAIMGASGIHPFTLEDVPPFTTLVVDLENSVRQTMRKFGDLVTLAGSRLDFDRVFIVCRPDGVNFSQADEFKWLVEQVAAVKPDLLTIGPLYKMSHGDPKEEEPARQISQGLDKLRTKFDLAMLIEAHTAKPGAGVEPMDPYGASLWRRWPEFGIFLGAKGDVKHWRGPRDERDWPAALQWGEKWPWVISEDSKALLWGRIQNECARAGRKLSQRELAGRIAVSQSSISKLIGSNGPYYKDWLDFDAAGAVAMD